MQGVIQAERRIISELQHEAGNGHEVLDELKRLQSLINTQEGPTHDSGPGASNYEELNSRAAEHFTTPAKSHEEKEVEGKGGGEEKKAKKTKQLTSKNKFPSWRRGTGG